MNSCARIPKFLARLYWNQCGISRRHFRIPSSQYNQRNFLSPDYECTTEWERRLETSLIKKVEIEDFFHQIDKKYQMEKVISAIDVDLFVNKITDEADLEDVEELTYRLRKSPATAKTLPSTSHAVIRTFLSLNRTDDLMRMLDDRINYGIFVDTYTANMLMDAFLKNENYRDAAKLACILMLQEDFESASTKFFALLSCLKYLEDPKPTSWDPFEVQEVQKTDAPTERPRKKKQEEERIRVNWQRNLFYDDHFDITNPQNRIGKTLAYISFNLSEDKLLKSSAEVLGWALFDKWNKVESCLVDLKKSNQAIASSVVAKLKELADARQAEIEASPDKTPARPKMHHFPGSNLEQEELDELFDTQLKWNEFYSPLPAVQAILKEGKISSSDVNMISKTEEYLSKAIASSEKAEIEKQKENYEHWQGIREAELKKQMDRVRDIQTLLDIQVKKKELTEREEVIFFFDNEEEWMMNQTKPQPEEPKKRESYGFPAKDIIQKAVIDENYVPPEVHDFTQAKSLDHTKPENPRKIRARERKQKIKEERNRQMARDK